MLGLGRRDDEAPAEHPNEHAPVNGPRLHAPIVLAHGLCGLPEVGIGPWTWARYFGRIPDWLQGWGNRVLVTRVHPTAGVRDRARRLAQRIEASLPEGCPFHLIGHSMGGLDARALASLPGWGSRLLSLTTVGTPHLGTTLADWGLERLRWLHRLVGATGWDSQGFLDVTRDGAEALHRALTPPEGLPCYSIAGAPEPGEVAPPLRLPHAVLASAEGPNDGLVGVESALAFGRPLEVWPADHFRQLTWMPPSRRALAAARTGYARLLGRLRMHDAEGGP